MYTAECLLQHKQIIGNANTGELLCLTKPHCKIKKCYITYSGDGKGQRQFKTFSETMNENILNT